jgi:hypothetical protein
MKGRFLEASNIKFGIIKKMVSEAQVICCTNVGKLSLTINQFFEIKKRMYV